MVITIAFLYSGAEALDLVIILVSFFFGLVLLLSFLFFLEVLAAVVAYLKPSKSQELVSEFVNQPTAILVPAHDEEDVLADTLQSIIPQLRTDDEIIVVADNCSDSTVDVASQYDVTVLVRNNIEQRGKGYALDFGLEYIKEKKFEVVVIVDADCILNSGSRDILVNATVDQKRPIQALYLMKHNTHNLTAYQKISEFAWLVKNKIRPLGLGILGGPCQLMGTGMAFPLDTLVEVKLDNGCVVEDMKLGLDLAMIGQAPKFLPAALVYSFFPSEKSSSEGQRSRWIHGHLAMILRYSPKLLLEAIKKRDSDIFLILLDLLILPLVMLLAYNLLVAFASILISMLSNSFVYLAACTGLLFFGLSLVISWLLEGKKIISVKELFFGGLALIKKFSVYTKFITDRRKEWNKTSRK